MGLRHKAFHAMLANPHLAPFELIEKSQQLQDWTLIDHLMVIHKVKEIDYFEGDSHKSISSMARRLALDYALETQGSRYVVLVKDGARAHKPAVREMRLNSPVAPHIEFCKSNLRAIEYAMMKLLAIMGLENNLFLVTGAKEDLLKDEPRTSVDNLVSFHQKWNVERQACGDGSLFASTLEDPKGPECDPSNIDPGYADRSINRPEGLSGVFIATFADPETTQVSVLRNACLLCTSTEADTLLVELANALTGYVTVCTGDSDVLAVLTACGREGITLRMDNKSYHENLSMHKSSFGELLFDTPNNHPSVPPFMGMTSIDRFRVLCDITAADDDDGGDGGDGDDDDDDDHLLPRARKQHNAFEAILDEYDTTKCNLKEKVARYLYLAGIRGSLYCSFLSVFFESNAQERLDNLMRDVNQGSSAKTVSYVFETLCPASNNTLPSGCELMESPPSTGDKRKRSCLEEPEVPDLANVSREVDPIKEQKRLMSYLKHMSKAYMNGMVPKGSHGRFLKLIQAGRYFFVRIKTFQDNRARMEKLIFMALCGTDYNIVPMGLGIKRLMTGAVTNHKSFSSWCRELERLLWDVSEAPSDDYFKMGTRLATFTNVPAKTQSKHWTESTCGLMFKTMKYVWELWNLKRPKPGSEYGFVVRDGVVRFNCEDSQLIDMAN